MNTNTSGCYPMNTKYIRVLSNEHLYIRVLSNEH